MSRTTSLGKATVRLLCATFGISRQAYYYTGGRRRPQQTAPAPRAPVWATTEQLVAAIEAIVQAHPGWGVRKVWAVLRRQGPAASHKRVWAEMHRLGLTLPPVAERREEAARGHVTVADSNRRWATDLTTVWTRQDGVVALVPVIDCGDRFALACAVTKSQEAPSVLAPVGGSLWREFHCPEHVPDGLELRSDHGPQYTGADCAELCARWRLDHTFAPVGRPTGNAVAERFILTLKLELIWTRDWESAAELDEAIHGWLDTYNQQRPHQALNWQTPAERRAANLDNRTAAALAAS
jgi:transposase InsO family protein